MRYPPSVDEETERIPAPELLGSAGPSRNVGSHEPGLLCWTVNKAGGGEGGGEVSCTFLAFTGSQEVSKGLLSSETLNYFVSLGPNQGPMWQLGLSPLSR